MEDSNYFWGIWSWDEKILFMAFLLFSMINSLRMVSDLLAKVSIAFWSLMQRDSFKPILISRGLILEMRFSEMLNFSFNPLKSNPYSMNPNWPMVDILPESRGNYKRMPSSQKWGWHWQLPGSSLRQSSILVFSIRKALLFIFAQLLESRCNLWGRPDGASKAVQDDGNTWQILIVQLLNGVKQSCLSYYLIYTFLGSVCLWCALWPFYLSWEQLTIIIIKSESLFMSKCEWQSLTFQNIL